MTLSTKGILERQDDEFRQQNIDFFLEQKKKKRNTRKANETLPPAWSIWNRKSKN